MKKNVKIDSDIHSMLKNYCDLHGYKIGKLIERLITQECQQIAREDKRVLLVDSRR